MKLLNGILICERHNALVADQIAHLDSIGHPMEHILYYGMDSRPSLGFNAVVLGCFDNYSNQALKVFGMFQHALALPGWTHFMKADVNMKVRGVKWELVEASDYAGHFIGPDKNGQSLCSGAFATDRHIEPLLRCRVLLPMPKVWCPGPAYFVSRRLAQLVVDKGAWWARGNGIGCDTMVAKVAEDNGIVPAAAVSYEPDNGPLVGYFNV